MQILILLVAVVRDITLLIVTVTDDKMLLLEDEE